MLDIKNLSYAYGKIQALNDISIHVNPGEILSIIGANGAGKSTLMKLIAGALRAPQGSIQFMGKPLPRHSHQIIQAGVALVPEGRWIFPNLSVQENLKLGGYIKSNADNKIQMERMYDMFPRLRERKDQRAGTLSGGEQQMLAIGRGLMSGPSLLLLDEPSLGLAPLIVNDIFNIVQEINQSGVTVLLVEQNAKKAMSIAQRVCLLDTGRVVKTATQEEMAGDASLIEAYLGGQRKK